MQFIETTRVQDTRPFTVTEQEYAIPQKSVFNKIVGDSHFELEFAAFLEYCPDVVSYTKNYFAIHFKLDYIDADGSIRNYYPDFLVRLTDGRVVVVETKGMVDLDVPHKMRRLAQWCEDVNAIYAAEAYDFVYVDQESFDRYVHRDFQQILDSFLEYKEQTLSRRYEHTA